MEKNPLENSAENIAVNDVSKKLSTLREKSETRTKAWPQNLLSKTKRAIEVYLLTGLSLVAVGCGEKENVDAKPTIGVENEEKENLALEILGQIAGDRIVWNVDGGFTLDLGGDTGFFTLAGEKYPALVELISESYNEGISDMGYSFDQAEKHSLEPKIKAWIVAQGEKTNREDLPQEFQGVEGTREQLKNQLGSDLSPNLEKNNEKNTPEINTAPEITDFL